MSIFFAPSPSSVEYATSAGSAGLATSSTSALNAAQAPAGFIVTGTVNATTVSATTYLNLGNTTAQWNASAIDGIPVDMPGSLTSGRSRLVYFDKALGKIVLDEKNIYDPTVAEITFQNLITSGDAGVSGSIRSVTVSATNYLNTGNTTAQWNASAIQSSPLSATLVPTTNQVLIYNGSVWTASTITTGGGGVTDHGALTGLSDDDHPQYVLSATNNALSSTVSNHIASASVHFTQAQIDHGTISGLGDNDHPQYVLSATNNALSSLVTNHIASASVHFTQAEIDHGTISGLGDNDHPQYVLSSTNNTLSSTVTNHLASAVHWDLVTLNTNYINASGDSVNAAFYFQTLSATTVSATNYFNLPSGVATWNANKLQGYDISAVAPSNDQVLKYNSTLSAWVPGTDNTGGGGGGGIADASSLRGVPLSATLVPTAGQALMYNGSVWTASAALFAYTYGSGAPTGGSDGDIYLQTDVVALQVPAVSATTYYNLPSGTLTWTYATSATSALYATNATSATLALNATNATSATSALNARQAPSGFSVTGSVTATTVSSTNLLTTSGDLTTTKLTDYSESKSSPTISSSALTLDLNNSQVFTVALNSNISTLTISNIEARANTAQGFTLILTADGTARTISWPGSVKWPSGTGPTLTSTNTKVDILSFLTPDNGTTWYGFVGGQNF
jgi:hypothetical protein